jgi:regulatory protein
MIITAIKQQQKRADFFSIFIDNKFAFSLSEVGLLNSKMKIGQEMTFDEYKALKKEATYDRLYTKTLYYLSLRPRSEWEINLYLQKNSLSTSLSQKVLIKLTKNNLINDELFTRFWIENRKLTKSMSKRRIISELQAKHINNDIINTIIDDIGLDDSESLLSLIEKKRKLSKYHDNLKLMQYLARQGYNYQNIKEALKKD